MATPNPQLAHVHDFRNNLDEVRRLLEIHEVVAGSGRGRKHDVEVLNKSAIVLVVACWEAYVEDLAESALRELINRSRDHTAFPPKVLDRVASKNSGSAAWNLAGQGWRSAMRSNFQEILAKTTATLNTPRAPQVDELFEKTIGLEAISKTWRWPSRTSAQTVAALDRLITTRGAIAHRVTHSKPILKRDVVSAIELVSRLAVKSSNRVSRYIYERTETGPWPYVSYKGMR